MTDNPYLAVVIFFAVFVGVSWLDRHEYPRATGCETDIQCEAQHHE